MIWVHLSLPLGMRQTEHDGWDRVVQMVAVPRLDEKVIYNDGTYTVHAVRWTPGADGARGAPGVVVVLR